MNIGDCTIIGTTVYDRDGNEWEMNTLAEAIDLAETITEEGQEAEDEEERWEEYERQDMASRVTSRVRDLMLDHIWAR